MDSVDEMMDILDSLGVRTVGSRGTEIQGFCPGHVSRTGHEDHNPSWYINSDTGAHICFSCQFKGSLNFLICHVKGFIGSDGYDFDQAKRWLEDKGTLADSFERATKAPKEIFEEVQIITEASLAAFDTPPDYALKSRGITRAAAEEYGLLWDERRELWIIPLRNGQTGRLTGWQEKAFRGRYFRNYPTGVQKSICIYGLEVVKDSPSLIVVESPLDAVRLRSIGIEGGVATYGSIISNEQFKLLRNSGKELTFAMDADEAGRAATATILRVTKVFGFECYMFDYTHTDAKDVGGMSKAEVLTGMSNRRHSLRYSAWLDN